MCVNVGSSHAWCSYSHKTTDRSHIISVESDAVFRRVREMPYLFPLVDFLVVALAVPQPFVLTVMLVVKLFFIIL